MIDTRAEHRDIAAVHPASSARPVLHTLRQLALCSTVFACLLVFLPRSQLWAERFALPKEAALHAGALLVAALTAMSGRKLRVDALDAAVGVFVFLGLLSTTAVAHNPWFAWRATLLTASGAVLFVCARSGEDEGSRAALIECVAWAVGCLAATVLLEAYGVLDGLSPGGRAPGGALGNRNRAAHLMVVGLPLIWLAVVRAENRSRLAGLLACAAAAGAVLTLSRTRAAWLAAAVVVCVVAGRALVRREWVPGRRTATFAAAVLGGVLVAVAAPNALAWRGGGGYVDTLERMGEYRSGSGRGRIVQYATTARMAADHPVLGVGPGNWSLRYLRYAAPGDPSVTPATLAPVDRLPQGDWIGIAAERGLPALLILGCVGWALLAGVVRRTPPGSVEARKQAPALAAVLAATAVLGSLDALLLTPAGACFAAVATGALAPPRGGAGVLLPSAARRAGATLALVLAAVALTQSIQRIRAARLAGDWYTGWPDAGRLARAVDLDPGSFEARVVLARALIQQERCDRALAQLGAADRLFPRAPSVTRLRAACAPPSPAAPAPRPSARP